MTPTGGRGSPVFKASSYSAAQQPEAWCTTHLPALSQKARADRGHTVGRSLAAHAGAVAFFESWVIRSEYWEGRQTQHRHTGGGHTQEARCQGLGKAAWGAWGGRGGRSLSSGRAFLPG